MQKDLKIEEKIKKHLTNMKPTAFFYWLRKQKDVLDEIIRNTSKLNDVSVKLRTRLFWYLNGLEDFPKCIVCGKDIKSDIVNMKVGYHKTCSKTCCYKDVSRNKRISDILLNKTNEEKLQIESRKQQTCLKRYGCKFTFQTENNKEKTKQTCLKKYGVENCMQSDVVKQTMKENNKKKYGCENVFQLDSTKAKSKETLKQHYGSEDSLYTNSVIAQKRIQHMTETFRKKSYNNVILKCIFDQPCFSEEYFVKNYSKDFEFEFQCIKCGNHFRSIHIDGCHMYCPKCYPRTASISERSLGEFIKSIYHENIILNNKKIIPPLELDVYLPEKKLAIEYDGLYWHAFENFNKTKGNKEYHLNKTQMCESKGIQLLHVFEDEWLNKTSIVKNEIKKHLKIYDKVIQASACQIKNVDNNAAKQFLTTNCLYGSINSKIKLGLYHKNELVCLMTFGKSRYDRKYEYELLRYCCKLRYNVVGGEAKLLKHFEKAYKPKSLITYCDRRYSQGEYWKDLGFKLSKITKPNYFYVDSAHKIRFSRMLFRKHLLKNKLKLFNPELSEYQNMRNNGYETIYDCGLFVFVKQYV